MKRGEIRSPRYDSLFIINVNAEDQDRLKQSKEKRDTNETSFSLVAKCRSLCNPIFLSQRLPPSSKNSALCHVHAQRRNRCVPVGVGYGGVSS